MARPEPSPTGRAIVEALDGRRNDWLAKKTGIHPATISRGINGRRPFNADHWRRIREALPSLPPLDEPHPRT